MERPCLPAFQLTDHVGRRQHGDQLVPILGRRIVPGDQRVPDLCLHLYWLRPVATPNWNVPFLQLAATNRIARCGTAPRNTEGSLFQEKPFLEPASLPLPPPKPQKPLGFAQNPQSFALILAYFNYCFMFLKMSVPVIRSSPAVQLPEFGTPSIVLTPKVMIGMIPDPDGT